MVGREREPVIVVDALMADPAALVELIAETCAFVEVERRANFYPGLRAPAPDGYVRALSRAVGPLVGRVFPDLAERKARAQASVSLLTFPPADLNLAQRIPHFDAPDAGQLALLHYLCGPEHGGTAFYRHRSTGFEGITAERAGPYAAALEAELRHTPPAQAYMAGDTALFEQIGKVEARFDRLVIYRSRLLHAGDIAPGCNFSPDPRHGRLTGNSFLFF